jgi:dihydrofolate synthase/folylpolyglutamate synthase
MFSQLPMYQQKGALAYRPDLSKMRDFCHQLDNPQDQIKTIHIAGTNGKGSTSHMMAAVLQEHGYRVGLYTSPHLKDYRERIRINGQPIQKDYVVEFVQKNRLYMESHALSFFEMTVGLAFSYFYQKKVDIAVVEVGMGGRLDGTNLISPELSIITNIGKDHTQFLGESLEEIAGEKAGIIKPNVPVIIGQTQAETQNVFIQKAHAMHSKIVFADQCKPHVYASDLKGYYQQLNLQTVAVALNHLRGFSLRTEKIKRGLLQVVATTGILGRWQSLGQMPLVVADVAHNKEGLNQIIPQIEAQQYKKLHLVLGFVKEKSLYDLLKIFPSHAHFYLCMPQIPRGLPVEQLAAAAEELHLMHSVFSNPRQALEAAKKTAHAHDFIFVGGSTFVVAEIL